MSEALQGLSTHLAGKFGDRIARSEIAYGELTVTVAPDDIVAVATFLRADPACTLGDRTARSERAYGERTVAVAPDDIVAVAAFLRDDPACQFVSMIDISGADYPSRAKRFDVLYHLLSPRKNLRIRVRVMTDED